LPTLGGAISMSLRRVLGAVMYVAALVTWWNVCAQSASSGALAPRAQAAVGRTAPTPAPTPAPTASPTLEPTPALTAASTGSDISAASCGDGTPHVELDGAVVVDGVGPRGLSLSPAACCEECHRTRGCNVWVACALPSSCGSQCWLKFAAEPSAAKERGRGASVPWNSGWVDKDVPALCYAMLCYAVLCYAVLCYALLCYAMLCYAMLCYAVLCYAMLCCAMLCYAVLCYAMLCYAMLCYAMLCYAMLCYAVPCHAMPCHTMPCHAMPCHAGARTRTRAARHAAACGARRRAKHRVWRAA
jgi:hypothetical protein